MKPTLEDVNESLKDILVHLENEYATAVSEQIELHLKMSKKSANLQAGNLLMWRGEHRTIIHVFGEYDGEKIQTYYLLDMGGGKFEKVPSIIEAS